MESRRYPTDPSDNEWRCIGPHLPGPAGRGRPRLHGLRVILNAVFYVLKSGCPWRLLPRDFPPWKTVYDWFRRWRIDGTWELLNAGLRGRLRSQVGRDPHPSAGIVDSQSAKTTGVGSKGATTAARRCAAESATCWWTPRGWSSKPRFTAPRSPTRTASGCCRSVRGIASLGSPACG